MGKQLIFDIRLNLMHCFFFQPNAAGLRWQQLLFEEWTTNVTLTPSSLSTRAFHGDYLLTVSYFDEVIQEQELTLIRGNNVFNVTIQ